MNLSSSGEHGAELRVSWRMQKQACIGSSGKSVTAISKGAARIQAPSNVPPEYGEHVSSAFSRAVVD